MTGACRAAVVFCAVWLHVLPAAAAGRAVAFAAADGTSLAGTFYASNAEPAPAVLLVHMLGGRREDWANVAERLQQQGLAALTIDLRGHGGSGGTSMPLAGMAQDVRAAATWLSARAGVRPNAIGIAGASLGGSFALRIAVELPAVRSVALLSPSLDFRGVRIDPALVRKYGARPLLFIASGEDPYALRTVKELVTDTSGIREQRVSSAVAHGTHLLTADADLTTALVDWFRRTLVF